MLLFVTGLWKTLCKSVKALWAKGGRAVDKYVENVHNSL